MEEANVGNVWAVFHGAYMSMGDVAVASARASDPDEWSAAHYAALRNAHTHEKEAVRWRVIADELNAGLQHAIAQEAESQGSRS